MNNLLEDGFLISDIANLLSVSERTIYRRMDEYGLKKEYFTDIEDGALEDLITNVITEFPFCGETLLRQILVQKNVKVNEIIIQLSLIFLTVSSDLSLFHLHII